ncbi:MAG: hypothetical protein ACJ72B_10785 [Ornithinibacter sp.]
MRTPFHLRRAGIAVAGAALLLAGAAGANAAGGPQPGTGQHLNVAASALTNPVMAPGSDLQFVAVEPCRILDTRNAGGVLHGTRTFDASLDDYASQGGKAATCNIPEVAMAVQLNLGAVSDANSASFVKGWAAGAVQPLASMLNYDPTGPVANMVTMPVNPLGQFSLQTPRTAHVFADVAGYYVQPLYASIVGLQDPLTGAEVGPIVWNNIQSGLVGVVRSSVGEYELTFNRNVTACVAVATDYSFVPVHEISTDSDFSQDSTVFVSVKDSSTGVPDDTTFHVALTC